MNRAECGALREALVRSDSLLSLLRHRCERTIPWGTPGLPSLSDVDEVIGQARSALASADAAVSATVPEAPEARDFDQRLVDRAVALVLVKLAERIESAPVGELAAFIKERIALCGHGTIYVTCGPCTAPWLSR